MASIWLCAALLVGQPPGDSGYLSVKSNLPGLAVYLEGDFIGRTPVSLHPVTPGSYILSVTSNDSLEHLYDRIRDGSLGRKLDAIWALIAANAGSQRVDIQPDRVKEAFVDYGDVISAPARAKWIAGGSLVGVLLVGTAIGLTIGLLAGG